MYLTTDGKYLYWRVYYVLPKQDGHQGELLITNGEEAEWKKIEDLVPPMKRKSMLPLGYLFVWPFQSGLDGTIPANGDTVSREEYSDLWEYLLQHPDWMKTENEWLSIASQNNGYVPYYSSGDGTTTFRTPKFAPYMCLNGIPGTYQEPGLPNITGEVACSGYQLFSAGTTYSGAFVNNSTVSRTGFSVGGESKNTRFGLDASKSDSIGAEIYGNSDTVTPESHVWNVFIVAQ